MVVMETCNSTWQPRAEHSLPIFRRGTTRTSWTHLKVGINLGTNQSWKMSNLLHGPISTNQILPQEKRVNRDIFGTSNLQNRTYGGFL